MKIAFTKMQGLGNDFIVIDATKKAFALTKSQIRKLADRHFGVGCDQLLIITSAPKRNVDFGYRIFNADGSEVSQCGNGARCIAKYIHDKKLSKKNLLKIATKAGALELKLEKNNQVTVNMGIPIFTDNKNYLLPVGNQSIEIGEVDMGNPHAVIIVDNDDQAPVKELGAQIEKHPHFPQGVNVGFMQIINPKKIRLRVFERGVGETLACGSGACAAVAVGKIRGLLDSQVNVELLGGNLHTQWNGEGQPLFMTGPAEKVFTGEWHS